MQCLEKRPMIMIVIGVLGISLSSIFVKYSAAPSGVTAAWRLIWTVALMTPLTLGRGEIRREIRGMGRKNLLLSGLSGLCLGLHFVLWFESLSHTSVASSTTIVCTEVIWVALGYCLFMGGCLSLRAMAAIGITLAGSVLVALSDAEAGQAHLYGDVLALLSAVAVGVYTLLGRVVRRQVSTAGYTYPVYVICAGALVLLSVFQGQGLGDYGMSPVIVGLLLAVFSTILGHSIFSWCLKFFSPAFVSASKLMEPVIAGAIAALLFGQIPHWLQGLGAAMILGGVLYYSRLERRAPCQNLSNER